MKLILQISHPCLQSSSKQNLQKLLILKLKFKKFVHFSFDETHKLSACEESQELPENNSTVFFFVTSVNLWVAVYPFITFWLECVATTPFNV
jgi:hypothetical protein